MLNLTDEIKDTSEGNQKMAGEQGKSAFLRAGAGLWLVPGSDAGIENRRPLAVGGNRKSLCGLVKQEKQGRLPMYFAEAITWLRNAFGIVDGAEEQVMIMTHASQEAPQNFL